MGPTVNEGHLVGLSVGQSIKNAFLRVPVAKIVGAREVKPDFGGNGMQISANDDVKRIPPMMDDAFGWKGGGRRAGVASRKRE
jgi:hypothetical protein